MVLSGKNLDSVSVVLSRPSCSKNKIAAAVNCLETDPILNLVCLRDGDKINLHF
jgi:hypothetical protein